MVCLRRIHAEIILRKLYQSILLPPKHVKLNPKSRVMREDGQTQRGEEKIYEGLSSVGWTRGLVELMALPKKEEAQSHFPSQNLGPGTVYTDERASSQMEARLT
jgi:hypothetical protein